MQHTDIEFLYAFSSHGVYLAEIKRLDVGSDAPPEDVYYWLRMEGEEGAISRLEFVSQSLEDGLEIREFADGVLTFDNSVGEYLLHNGEGMALDRIGKGAIEKSIKKRFFAYLQSIVSDGSKPV